MFFPIGDDLQKRYFPAVGAVIIGLNLVVFLYQVRLWNEALETMPRGLTARQTVAQEAVVEWYKSTDYAQFENRWGVVPSNIASGHVMCVVTYMFLHGGFVHFLGNMIVLWVFVGSLENTLGQTRFLCCYLGWGIVGGIAHAALCWGQSTAIVGASGAVAGVIGAYFIAFGAVTRIRVLIWILIPFRLNLPAGAFVVLWLLSQLVGMDHEARYGSGIGWYAPLCGFLAGVVTMGVFKREVHARLARDRAGNLEILPDADLETPKDADPAVIPDAATPAEPLQPADVAPATPQTCPDCGTSVSEGNRIFEKMLRCPNPKCQKLIYH